MEIKDLQILIADSHLATNLHLKIQLEKLGYSVIATAENAFRLLYLLEKLNPNVIILDTELLNPSVEHCLEQSKIPVLFTTYFGTEDLLVRLIKQKNTIGYLVKPLDKFSLCSSIQWAARFHLYNQQESENISNKRISASD